MYLIGLGIIVYFIISSGGLAGLGGLTEKVKSFFSKFNPFGKSDLEPASATATSSSNAIIDNSVKTVNQNNQNTNTNLSSRNDDNSLFKTSDVYI